MNVINIDISSNPTLKLTYPKKYNGCMKYSKNNITTINKVTGAWGLWDAKKAEFRGKYL